MSGVSKFFHASPSLAVPVQWHSIPVHQERCGYPIPVFASAFPLPNSPSAFKQLLQQERSPRPFHSSLRALLIPDQQIIPQPSLRHPHSTSQTHPPWSSLESCSRVSRALKARTLRAWYVVHPRVERAEIVPLLHMSFIRDGHRQGLAWNIVPSHPRSHDLTSSLTRHALHP